MKTEAHLWIVSCMEESIKMLLNINDKEMFLPYRTPFVTGKLINIIGNEQAIVSDCDGILSGAVSGK